jgi:RNA polymerase sigma-70 factor (ECF subfamily)
VQLATVSGLVSAAQAGDDHAFGALVRHLHPQLFRWAVGFAADADEADDIVQLAFVTLHQRLHEYRPVGPVQAWIYRIVRRAAEDLRRTRARRRRLASTLVNTDAGIYRTDPGARVDRERLRDIVQRFFADLPPRQREVFDLVDLQGYEPAEVASMTKLKPVTVRANLFKARQTIRARLLDIGLLDVEEAR